MRKTPQRATEEEQKKRQRKRATKQMITRAVTHIRLSEANPGKLAALDHLVVAYRALTQQHVTRFCEAQTPPDKFAVFIVATKLSDRWHRVALQQAAGIAKSWRTNRQNAYEAYLEERADYAKAKAKAEACGVPLDPKRKDPEWRDWKLPELRVPAIQANANVVVLEKAEDSTFDYWLRISTLDKGRPLRVPVKLASYHKQTIAGRILNTSITLHTHKGSWWLTLSFDEDVPLQTASEAPRVGVDVGIVHFITTSTNKEYGSFHGKMARRVNAAYSSQECPCCYFVDRANRPNQQTFCCVVCGSKEQADRKAAHTLADRWEDTELATCRDKKTVKALLLKRHENWKQKNGLVVVQPAVQLGLWDLSQTSTDVAER